MRVALVLCAVLLAGACRPPAKLGEPNPKATFRGYGHCEFEGSYFIGCGSNAPFWIDCHEPSMAVFLEVQDGCELRPCSADDIYVELEGVLSPEGSYGHLGYNKHKLTPTHVHYASIVGPSSCERTDPDKWVNAWTNFSQAPR